MEIFFHYFFFFSSYENVDLSFFNIRGVEQMMGNISSYWQDLKVLAYQLSVSSIFIILWQ